MKCSEIFDEMQGGADIRKAMDVYSMLNTFFETEDMASLERVVRKRWEGFFIQLWKIGIDTDLSIYFTEYAEEKSPALSFLNGKPVMILPILPSSDLVGLSDSFNSRETYICFIHEYAHCSLWERTKYRGNSTGKSERDYFNHPCELEAYYKEAVIAIVDYMRGLVSSSDAPIIADLKADTEKQLIERVWQQIDEHFRENLTPENTQRVLKRVAGFVRGSLMPMVQGLSAA